MRPLFVIPAQAGTQTLLFALGPRLRWDDEILGGVAP